VTGAPGRRDRCSALLLDLDGVLRRFDPARVAEVETRHGPPAGTLLSVAFTGDRLRPALTGEVTHETWMSGVAEAVADQLRAAGGADPESAAPAVAAWSAHRGEVVPEVLEFVRRVRSRGIRVGLATNATDWLDADLAKLGLTGEVDAVLNSSVVGHAKPAREFFRAGCLELRTVPKRVLFVDDEDRNVRGARETGLAALRYTGPDSLRYAEAALTA
jgi:putative hydrolase of the HAD superfamily